MQDAVHRELTKRIITYPKELNKMRLKLMEKHEDSTVDEIIRNMSDAQLLQNLALERVSVALYNYGHIENIPLADESLSELVREMNMRLKLYPFFIMKKILTPEAAEDEKATWKAIIAWWRDTYCPTVEIQFLKTRCKIL